MKTLQEIARDYKAPTLEQLKEMLVESLVRACPPCNNPVPGQIIVTRRIISTSNIKS